MARKVAKFVDGKTTILVETTEEVDRQSSGGMETAGIGDKLKAYFFETADETFTDAMGAISYASNTILKEIEKIDEPPASAEVEFSIKITGKGEAMIASGGVEANYKVKLSWKKPEQSC